MKEQTTTPKRVLVTGSTGAITIVPSSEFRVKTPNPEL